MGSVAYVIDFGTSNSGIGALRSDGDFRIAKASRPVGADGDSSIFTEPSWIYIDDSGQKLAGWDALYVYQRMLEQNRSNDRAQLISALKNDLGSVSMHGSTFFARWDMYLSLQDMISIVFKHLRATAEKEFGDSPGSVRAVLIAHPVVFVGSRVDFAETISGAQHDALEVLRKAAGLAGFTDVEFYDEASASSRAHNSMTGKILSLDFGGGTLDVAACSKVEFGQSEIVSVKGAPIGGNDIDKELFEHLLFDRLGLNSDENQQRALPNRHRRIRNLNEYLSVLRDVDAVSNASYCSQAEGNENLLFYIQHLENPRGIELYRNLMAAKAKLEVSQIENIEYKINPKLNPWKIELTSAILRDVFASQKDKISRTILAALEEADWNLASIDGVVLSGGSSRLRAFRDLISELLPNAKQEMGDPFINVLEGLGARAMEIERWK